MSLRSATNRADLLWFQHDLQELGSVAALAGFERQPGEDSAGSRPNIFEISHQHPVNDIGETPAEEPPIDFPEKRPPLEFFVPVRKETLKPLGPAAPQGDPISDAELAVDWKVPGSTPRPLAPWSRLAPFLKSRLGATLLGHRLDTRRLVREAGRGLPVVRLPRLPRAVWAAQALVVRDESKEMIPFGFDTSELVRRLRRERRKGGLKVVKVRDIPHRDILRGVPPDVPVVALTCLGRHGENRDASDAWMHFGEVLLHRRQPTAVLMPCSLESQSHSSSWEEFVWDHRCRLPQRRGQRLPAVTPSWDIATLEALLDLLSPASRVSSALLRDVRLLMGSNADVSIEWNAWFHEGGWHSLDCFGFEDGDLRNARLERRKLLRVEKPDLVRAVDHLIARHHEDCCVVVAGEATLRALLSSDRDSATLGQTVSLLERVVDRLRVMATDPGSQAGLRSGLAEWFLSFVATLPPDMRSDLSVADLVARGLALAQVFLESGTLAIPKGVDETVYREETRASAQRLPEARTVQVVLRRVSSHDTQLIGFSVPGRNAPPDPHKIFLAQLASRSRVIHLSGAHPRRIEFQDTPSSFFIPALDRPGEFSVQSDLEALHFKAMSRPAWAQRMWYDRQGLHAATELNGTGFVFDWRLHLNLLVSVENSLGEGEDGTFEWSPPQGQIAPVSEGRWSAVNKPAWASRLFVDEYGLAAEFRIRDVPFVLRWIPPGSFLMGSPEDEPGRFDDEGPQHEVAITKGFWMGETQVTQAQWEAVVTAAYHDRETGSAHRKRSLKKNPSHFKGPRDLPVESVSWDDCQVFCELLNALMPDGPGFRMPSEAQWERACRAGTDTALYTGDTAIVGENNAPALDDIAWYGGNSGMELEVDNPYDSKGWSEKQHDHAEAGTHRVKLKKPNSFGLYDSIGNVWEWCRDAWDEEAYGKRDPSVEDPEVTSNEASAYRVVRGGSWYDFAWGCRAASRYGIEPVGRDGYLGLRLSAGQEPSAAEPPARSAGPERRSRARRGSPE